MSEIQAEPEAIRAAASAHDAITADAAELATLRELRKVAAHFTGTWAELIHQLPDSYSCEMNCAEANAAADLYRAFGDDSTAAAIIAAHAATDDDEERAGHAEDQ